MSAAYAGRRSSAITLLSSSVRVGESEVPVEGDRIWESGEDISQSFTGEMSPENMSLGKI